MQSELLQSRCLIVINIEVRAPGFTERVVQRVGDDTHDDVGFLYSEHVESLPECLAPRPQSLGHGPIDDSPPEFAHGRGIRFLKTTTCNHGDVHRAEIIEPDGAGLYAQRLGILVTGKRDLACEASAIEQYVARNSRRNDARNGAQTIIYTTDECRALGVVVAEHAEVEADDRDVVGIEPRIDFLGLAQ